SDLPAAPTQYDFVGDDFNASGMAAMGCAGGTCPWHGNGSAGVALGRVNNSAAAAGTGGTVADPMLFNINGRQQVTHRAVRTAVVWGADVVNMSFGGNCNLACRQFDRKDNVYADASAAGVVLVASAGNSGVDTGDDNFVHPCINDGVICVGAVADEGNTRFVSPSWSSNFGGGVDIWAPTNLRAMADGSSSNGLITFGGTSSSAPFISGVAAMLKALDPALTGEQVRQVLRDTAWTDSPDGDVSHVVNALQAVRAVSEFRLPADRFEPNNAPASARVLPVGRNEDLTLHSGLDADVYNFTLSAPSMVTLDLTYPTQLGKLAMRDLGLGQVNSCGSGALLGDTASAPTPGRTVTYRLPQGTYSLDLGSVQALPYDLQLSTSSLGGATLPPDSYEPNDSFATRRDLGDGRLVQANLSSASDVDFYRFYSRGNFNTIVMSMTSEAEVRDSDVPLTLSLYDGSGNLVQTVTASADCSTQAVFAVPAGFWVVRVSGPGAGYYSLWLGSTGRQNNIVDIGKIFYLIFHPDEPVQHLLTEPREWVMVFNNSDYLLEGMQVDGPGVRVKLLDEQGKLLVEGVSRGEGQELRLPAASSDRLFIVQMERVGEDGAVVQG
ncbi:MAG: S8/S53 family peptidase, partial [Myxococcaceae bacterium]